MSPRIGVAVAADRVRAVGVRRGRALWAMEGPVDCDAGVGEAIRQLLAAAPRAGLFRPRVSVAVGPSHSQVKHLKGLPPLVSARDLARLVREGAGRFFLRGSAPLTTTGVRVIAPGEVWAAAIDLQTLREVEAACRGVGMRLDTVTPTAVALAHGLTDDVFRWHDGGLCIEVQQAGGALVSVRRYRSADPSVPQAPPAGPEALANLGEGSWRFADAFGAATLPPDEPLVVRGTGGPDGSRSVPPWRIAAATAALLLTVVASQAAPVLAAQRAGARAEMRRRALEVERRHALEAEAELERVTAALSEIVAFDVGRKSATWLLAELARALPDGAAVVTLRVDSVGGILVALAPRAGAVLESMEVAPGLTSIEIAGPVTPEVVAGHPMERVTLRFRIEHDSQPWGAAGSARSPP